MISTGRQRTFLSFDKARRQIHQADALLYRRRGLISIAGRGVHSHAAMAVWWNGDKMVGQRDLMCVETRSLVGFRAVSLRSQVERYPGRIDVLGIKKWIAPTFDPEGAARFMRQMCGRRYGYRGLIAAAMLHLPIIRCFVSARIDDKAVSRRPPFCSQALALAYRLGGGVDPVPFLSDGLTEPADLARSAILRYRFTLVP
jgi:hypothetical protein